ncbi:hypothetical protein H0A70_07955 [Alcaligenaceae bacterium]|nr:hypothetical protein [Alcaligenaceae bacterium]
MRSAIGVALIALALSGCATWSTAQVDSSTAESSATISAKSPEEVKVYETDVAGRRYESLGDLNVTVNKTTLFHPNPTKELVEKKLREKAAAMGADAVIFATYGNVGVSFMSWGSMDGRGRAIRFLD